MPYTLPADMARQLLYLAGDKVDFDPWKRKLLEGGWMPRGGSGRSAGGGGVVQMPSRASNEQSLTDFGRTFGRPSDQQRYEDAVAAQRLRNMPEFNPQMTNPYPSKSMAQSYQERQPIPISAAKSFNERLQDKQLMSELDRIFSAPPTPNTPELNAFARGLQQQVRSRGDTAQTSFPAQRAQEMNALREKLEMAQYGRLLNEYERANLNRPGWEQPQ